MNMKKKLNIYIIKSLKVNVITVLIKITNYLATAFLIKTLKHFIGCWKYN